MWFLYLSFTENRSKKPFFYRVLLKIYELWDFMATFDNGVYRWWSHQINTDVSKIIFVNFQNMVYIITTFLDSSSSYSEIKEEAQFRLPLNQKQSP